MCCCFLHIYSTFLLERLILSVCHNNDYTSIGYKRGNIVSNIINFLALDYSLSTSVLGFVLYIFLFLLISVFKQRLVEKKVYYCHCLLFLVNKMFYIYNTIDYCESEMLSVIL